MNDIPCGQVPLRALPLFVPYEPGDIECIQSLKKSRIDLAAGAAIIHEGRTNAPLLTLFSGWAFRFKTLSDGWRQILNFLLPGDFIGLQQKMTDASAHGVEALSDVSLCTFQRDALWPLPRAAPSIGLDITWLAAREESLVDDNRLSLGRRSAEERIAALLILLFKRAAAVMPWGGADGVPFPLTQQHIAEGLGLSWVHTNKTLRELERRELHRIEGGRLHLRDVHALVRLADLYGNGRPSSRPLI